MRYMRLKKQEGVRLFKDTIFYKITLDFLHNSYVEVSIIILASFDKLKMNGF